MAGHTLFFAVGIALTGLMVTGCGGVEVPLGDSGQSVTIEDQGDTTTFTDEESGLSVTTGEGVEVPAAFPSDFPLPDGATLMSAGENEGFVVLLFEWEGMTKDSFMAYIEQAKAAGYSNTMEVSDLDLGGGAFNTAISLSNGTTELLVSGLGDPAGPGQLSITAGPAGG